MSNLAAPEGGEFPAGQKLLSKGRRAPLESDRYATLLSHFNLSGDVVAPFSALGDGLDVYSGWWLCADPVHFMADRDQLILSASNSLDVTRAEADALIAELNRTYAEDGWHFFAPHPQRWYLQLPEAVAMQTVPTVDAMGHRVGEVLPQGDDAMQWQRVMTEVQMVLHGSTTNLQRESQGQMTINGLWFWGGGLLPEVTGSVDWDSVISDQPLSRGLARLYGLSLEEGDRVLHHCAIESPEEELFVPLLRRLESGELYELVVEIPGVGRWRIERKDLRRWWRRSKSLDVLLKGLM
ncbi:MAG: hypothetical protein OEZ16_12540 [Chromatiales bacterium]|nr:hypothetical protein [Chromatiales bacterium]